MGIETSRFYIKILVSAKKNQFSNKNHMVFTGMKTILAERNFKICSERLKKFIFFSISLTFHLLDSMIWVFLALNIIIIQKVAQEYIWVYPFFRDNVWKFKFEYFYIFIFLYYLKVWYDRFFWWKSFHFSFQVPNDFNRSPMLIYPVDNLFLFISLLSFFIENIQILLNDKYTYIRMKKLFIFFMTHYYQYVIAYVSNNISRVYINFIQAISWNFIISLFSQKIQLIFISLFI